MNPEIEKLVEDYQEADLAEINESFLESYVELATNEFVETAKSCFVGVCQDWIEMGLPDNERERLHHGFSAKITAVIDQYRAEQKDRLAGLVSYLDFTLIEVNKILKDLTLPEYVVDANKSLLAKCKLLKIKKTELEAVKLERLSQLDMIVQKWKRILARLGEDWVELHFETNIPAEFELTMARSNMVNREETYKKRKAKFDQVKKQIVASAKDIDYCLDDYPFMTAEEVVYSTDLMAQLDQLHLSVAKLHKKAVDDKQVRIGKLEKLFERVKVEPAVRSNIINAQHPSLAEGLKFLDSEIDKYELIKLGMIKDITMDVRQKVADLLDHCRSKDFPLPAFFYSQEDFTEAKLEQHERFLEHLTVYSQAFSSIFEQLQVYEDTVEKALELEVKIQDPNKYKNRGGTLMTNQRDHERLKKRLDHLEKEITIACQRNHTISFSQYGFEIHQYFADKHQDYEDSVESIKASFTAKSKTNSKERILPSTISTGSTKKTGPPPPPTQFVRSAFKAKPTTANPTTTAAAARPLARRPGAVPTPKKLEAGNAAELAFQRNLMNRENVFQSTVIHDDPYPTAEQLQERLAAPVNVFDAPSVTKRRRVSRSVERTTPKRKKLFSDDLGTPRRF